MSPLVRFCAPVVLAFIALPVGAAPASGPDAAYKAAVKLEASGDIAGALAAFEAIAPEKRDVATRVHIANCKAKLNRLLDAERDFEALKADPKLDAAWAETIASDLQALRERIPRIRLRLAGGTTNVTVTVDGKTATPPADYPVDPGTHVVRATRGDAVAFERKMQVAEGTLIEVVVDAPEATKPSDAPLAPVSATPAPESHAASRGISPIPFFAGAGALAAGSIVSFVVAASAQDDVEANCRLQLTPTCDTSAAGASRVRTWETIGWVTGGLAVASLGVGLVMLTRKDERSVATVTAAPSVGFINGLVVEGRF